MAANVIPGQPHDMTDEHYAHVIRCVVIDEFMNLAEVAKQAQHLARAYKDAPVVANALQQLALDALHVQIMCNHSTFAEQRITCGCQHVAVDTGTRKTWCRTCEVLGEWTPAGVRWQA